MAPARDRRSAVEQEATEVSQAVARFDRLRAVAETPGVSTDVRARLLTEARDIVNAVGPVRLSVARNVLSIPDTTLREWISDGMIEVVAHGPARLDISDVLGLRDALQGAGARARKRRLVGRADDDTLADRRSHSELLTTIDDMLAEIPANLVVLFGSAARGTDGPASDVDLLIDVPDDDGEVRRRFAEALSRRLGRPVDTVTLRSAERQPWLLASVLHDGHVIRDERGAWPRLQDAAAATQAAARRAHDDLVAEARAALVEMKDAS